MDPPETRLQVEECLQTERKAGEGETGQDRERKSDSPAENPGLSPGLRQAEDQSHSSGSQDTDDKKWSFSFISLLCHLILGLKYFSDGATSSKAPAPSSNQINAKQLKQKTDYENLLLLKKILSAKPSKYVRDCTRGLAEDLN